MGVPNIEFAYKSSLQIEECMKRICCAPCTFGNDIHNPEHYECMIYSETQLTVIFTGCQFGGTKRTEYLFTFTQDDTETLIVAKFQREFLFFIPFTVPPLLDLFVEQKVEGVRL